MRNFIFLAIFTLFIVSCGNSASIPTLTPIVEASPAPTITLSPILSPTPTFTPVPLAVPMIYEGWTDKAFSKVCIIYSDVTGIQHQAPGTNEIYEFSMEEAGSAVENLVEEMGMIVVPADETCQAAYSYYMFLTWDGQSEFHEDGTICRYFSKLILEGSFDFIDNGSQQFFSIPLLDEYIFEDEFEECDKLKEPPYNLMWPRTILEALGQIYGENVFNAALKIPVFETAALELLQE